MAANEPRIRSMNEGGDRFDVNGHFRVLAVQEQDGRVHHYRHPLFEGDYGVYVAHGNLVERRCAVNCSYHQFLGVGVDEDVVVLCGIIKEEGQIQHVYALGRLAILFVKA